MPRRTPNKTAQSAVRAAVHLHQLADDCAAFPRALIDDALPHIGAEMKRLAQQEAKRVTGGDQRLSRMNRGRGVRLDAGYDNVGPATVRLTPRPLGPWVLVESGSNRSNWYIPRAGKALTKRGKRKTRRRLRLHNGGVRWYVRHPSVRGKRAWSRARSLILDGLPDVVHESIARAWSDVRRAA